MNKEYEMLMNIDIDINSLMEKIPVDDNHAAMYVRYNDNNGGVSRTILSSKDKVLELLLSLVFSSNEKDSDTETQFYLREAMLNVSIEILKQFDKDTVDGYIKAIKDNCY